MWLILKFKKVEFITQTKCVTALYNKLSCLVHTEREAPLDIL